MHGAISVLAARAALGVGRSADNATRTWVCGRALGSASNLTGLVGDPLPPRRSNHVPDVATSCIETYLAHTAVASRNTALAASCTKRHTRPNLCARSGAADQWAHYLGVDGGRSNIVLRSPYARVLRSTRGRDSPRAGLVYACLRRLGAGRTYMSACRRGMGPRPSSECIHPPTNGVWKP